MTELELAIGHLKETISVGNVLLAKLEKQQEEASKPKVPVFPYRFIAVPDKTIQGYFVIGLRDDGPTLFKKWSELPEGFVGRSCFSRETMQELIKGLQTLLGESNG